MDISRQKRPGGADDSAAFRLPLICIAFFISWIPTARGTEPEAAILRVVIAGDTAFISRINGTVESIRVAEGTRNWRKDFHKNLVDVLAVSAGDALFGVSASDDPARDEQSSLVVWRTRDGETVRLMSIDFAAATAAISPDGTDVVVGGYAGEDGQLVRIFGDRKPKPIAGFETSMVSRISTADATNFLVGTETGELAKVPQTGPIVKLTPIRVGKRTGRIEALCALSDNLIAIGTERGCLALVDGTNGDILFKRDFPGGLGVREIRVRGSVLIACSHEKLIVARISGRKLEDVQEQTSKLGQINSFDITAAGDAITIGHNSGVLSRLSIDCNRPKLGSASDEQEIKIVAK